MRTSREHRLAATRHLLPTEVGLSVRSRTLLAAWCAVLAGCGGSPTAPATNGTLPFRSGAYILDLAGGSSECGDIKNPQAGTLVSLRLNMDVSANRYVATSAQGGLVVQFERGDT